MRCLRLSRRRVWPSAGLTSPHARDRREEHQWLPVANSLRRSSRTITAWPAAQISLAPAVRAKPRQCAMGTAAGVGTMGCCAANTPPRPRR
jgi:hypothetical protein